MKSAVGGWKMDKRDDRRTREAERERREVEEGIGIEIERNPEDGWKRDRVELRAKGGKKKKDATRTAR